MESKACSDKKSRLSALIGFHQKMQQPLHLQLCVFPLPNFWQQSIWEMKGTFLHADLTQSNLTKSLPCSESFAGFAPSISCSNSLPSKRSKSLLLAISFLVYSFHFFFSLSSHLEFPLLFLVQQVNILIFTSQWGKLVYVHFQTVKIFRTIQSITLKFLYCW